MRRGTILFFSADETVAHIWCPEAENPLFLARQEGFPELWPRLTAGMTVDLCGPEGGETQEVAILKLVAEEDV